MKPMPIAQYLSRRGPDPSADPQRDTAGARVIRAFVSPPAGAPASLAPASPVQVYARPLAGRADESGAPDIRHPDFPPPPRPANDMRDAQLAKAIEARIEEAHARGRQEAIDAAREESAAARRAEIEEMRRSLEDEQLRLRQDEMAGVAVMLSTTLLEVETRISASIARILTPIVAADVVRRMLEEFSLAMATMRLGVSDAPVVVRGQSYLLAGLRRKIVELGLNVELVEDEGVELAIEAGETSIESSLQSWMGRIADLEA